MNSAAKICSDPLGQWAKWGASNDAKGYSMITLSAAITALILIDLQKGIVGRQFAPDCGEAVLAKGKELARSFQVAKAQVVLVNAAFAPGFLEAQAPVDRPLGKVPPGGFTGDWFELADGLAEASDLKAAKLRWDAFYCTDVDLQLRRPGVTTVVTGGIATNMGVESIARTAQEHGYAVVLAEDAAASLSAEMHAFAFEHIFPHLGRVAMADKIEI
jgi:nicotinamidase-related amidase